MRFVVTGEWTRNRLLQTIVVLYAFYVAALWVTNALLYFSKMGLTPASVVEYYLGSEERFLSPRQIDRKVDPMLRGSVAHTTLHRFYDRLPRAIGSDRQRVRHERHSSPLSLGDERICRCVETHGRYANRTSGTVPVFSFQ